MAGPWGRGRVGLRSAQATRRVAQPRWSVVEARPASCRNLAHIVWAGLRLNLDDLVRGERAGRGERSRCVTPAAASGGLAAASRVSAGLRRLLASAKGCPRCQAAAPRRSRSRLSRHDVTFSADWRQTTRATRGRMRPRVPTPSPASRSPSAHRVRDRASGCDKGAGGRRPPRPPDEGPGRVHASRPSAGCRTRHSRGADGCLPGVRA